MDRNDYLAGLYEVRRILERVSALESELKRLNGISLSPKKIRQDAGGFLFKKTVFRVFLLAMAVVVVLALVNIFMLHKKQTGSIMPDSIKTFVAELIYLMIRYAPIAIVPTALAAVHYYKRAKQNWGDYEQIRRQNAENGNFNMRLRFIRPMVEEKKTACTERLRVLVERYRQHCQLWFPQDYGYLEAVDFFIRAFVNHASSMEAVIADYKQMKRDELENMYRSQMLQNSAMSLQNQSIMIDQQNMLLSEAENIERMQMLNLMLNLF